VQVVRQSWQLSVQMKDTVLKQVKRVSAKIGSGKVSCHFSGQCPFLPLDRAHSFRKDSKSGNFALDFVLTATVYQLLRLLECQAFLLILLVILHDRRKVTSVWLYHMLKHKQTITPSEKGLQPKIDEH